MVKLDSNSFQFTEKNSKPYPIFGLLYNKPGWLERKYLFRMVLLQCLFKLVLSSILYIYHLSGNSIGSNL
jgi:hypothetical protein